MTMYKFIIMLLLFPLTFTRCSSQESPIKESIVLKNIIHPKDGDFPNARMYFFEQERREYPEIDKMVVGILRNFVKEINNQIDGEIYVPRDGEEKKISILEGVRNNSKWNFKVITYKHEYSDIVKLAQLLEKSFSNSEAISQEEIDLVYLPIEYFDIKQIKKL